MDIDIAKLRTAEELRGKLVESLGIATIHELANDGIMPHYRITNPKTQETGLLFVQEEVNAWIGDNLTVYEKGYIVPEWRFFYFDRSQYPVVAEVPEELAAVADLRQLPLTDLATPPGIYFLCKGKQIRFIGRSTDITKRIIDHQKEGDIDFDAVFFLQCPVHRLTALHESLVKYLKPAQNEAKSKGNNTRLGLDDAEAILKPRKP